MCASLTRQVWNFFDFNIIEGRRILQPSEMVVCWRWQENIATIARVTYRRIYFSPSPTKYDIQMDGTRLTNAQNHTFEPLLSKFYWSTWEKIQMRGLERSSTSCNPIVCRFLVGLGLKKIVQCIRHSIIRRVNGRVCKVVWQVFIGRVTLIVFFYRSIQFTKKTS